jgi:NAD(P)-dependent dehydrogenase (short-subunit alcohol dehydrogenase family)
MKDLEPLSKLISLKGKKALITGSALGIGKAMAYRFAEAGADLELVDINLKSALLMGQHMIKRRLRKGRVIINIGSIEALIPFVEGMASYSISKAGVIALTRSLAKEDGKNRFRVNAIIPGGIITPGTKAVAKEVAQLRLGLLRTGVLFSTRLPLRRGGQPDEVARITVVLASDLASYVHGALIPVDGGFLSA